MEDHQFLANRMAGVPTVTIQPGGVYKYVLLELLNRHADADNPRNGDSKLIVRGFEEAEYHAEIAEAAAHQMEALGLECRCTGGGRINFDALNNDIFVYGYSVAYGQADHSAAVALIQQEYPGYNVHFSNDGY
eukprot:m.11459 g.11459  ORF g.11459 m.11459 type:complete len:133 (-) comp5723_c0_seq2:174-572(-)